MSLPASSADLELGASENDQQSIPPQGIARIRRRSHPTVEGCTSRSTDTSSSTDTSPRSHYHTPATTPPRDAIHHHTPPRDAVHGGVKLLDIEIEALWKYTYRNEPCPSKTDVVNRWMLLELAEKFWKDEVTDITSRLDRAKDDVSSANNELYQILGFYSVFQGLLVGAACQSQKLSCRKRDPLFVLCAIITVYALVGFYLKFHDFHGKQIYVEKQQQRRNQRKAQITRLRRERLKFEFMPPRLVAEPSKIWIYIIRVILVLAILTFSGVIIGCIDWILC